MGPSGGLRFEICEPMVGKSRGDGGSNWPEGETLSGVHPVSIW